MPWSLENPVLRETRKRKRPTTRPNEYELETSPTRAEVEEPVARTFRRPRKEVKAQPPLVQPKRSSNLSSQTSLHLQTRPVSNFEGLSSKKTQAVSSLVASNPPLAQVTGLNSSQPAQARRGRGRPRINKGAPNSSHSSQSNTTTKTKGRPKKKISPPKDKPLSNDAAKSLPKRQSKKSTPITDEEQSRRQGELEGNHTGETSDSTENMMNSSPNQAIRATKPTTSNATKPKQNSEQLDLLDGTSEYEYMSTERDDNDDNDDDDDDDDDAADYNFPDLESLKEMKVISKHVGCKHDVYSDKWSKIKTQATPKSVQGVNLITDLKELRKMYQAIRTADTFPKEIISNLSRANLIDSIEMKVLSIINQSFESSGANHNEDVDISEVRKILIDVYFTILPYFVQTIYSGAKTYIDKESIDTASLEEIVNLAETLQKLAVKSLAQPKDTQPRVQLKKKNYQIRQPIRNLKSRLGDFINRLKRELGKRTQAARAENNERRCHERELIRREREQQENMEKAERNRDINKRQQNAIEEALAEPFWGEVAAAAIYKLRASQIRTESTQMTRKASSLSRSTRGGVDEDPDDDEGNSSASGGDVSFPANNVNGSGVTKPWTWEERDVFIAVMRNNGPNAKDRYQQVADRVNRPIDEVFAMAKEFQEYFDIEHQNLRFEDECDGWTYEVWVNQVWMESVDE